MANVALLIGSSLIAGLSVWAASGAFGPIPHLPNTPERNAAVSPDRGLLEAYEACSKSALVRVLSQQEAAVCSEIYLDLKLSFLPAVTPDAFKTLPALERWDIQQQGYAALLAWRRDKLGEVKASQSDPAR